MAEAGLGTAERIRSREKWRNNVRHAEARQERTRDLRFSRHFPETRKTKQSISGTTSLNINK